MINTVINSTSLLIGLAPSVPIFITIDDLNVNSIVSTKDTAELNKKREALEAYSTNLFNKYMANPRFHILPGMTHLHIGGSVMKALDLIGHHYPKVQYVYYIQHDFQFTLKIDHIALVDVMEKYPEVNMIRFPKRYHHSHRTCGNKSNIIHPRRVFHANNLGVDATKLGLGYDQMVLYPTDLYSDNNHFARFDWYKETIASLDSLRRPPEAPLMVRSYAMCARNESMGLFMYDQIPIGHLDGRKSTEY
jgi:hypothetical protein